MSQSSNRFHETYTPNSRWKAPARVLHWLIAISMSGATFLTSQGTPDHAMLGWVALGGLFIQLFVSGGVHASRLVPWLVITGVFALNLSDLLAAHSTFHLGATLVVLVFAAIYCATVMFELLQKLTAISDDRSDFAPEPVRGLM